MPEDSPIAGIILALASKPKPNIETVGIDDAGSVFLRRDWLQLFGRMVAAGHGDNLGQHQLDQRSLIDALAGASLCRLWIVAEVRPANTALEWRELESRRDVQTGRALLSRTAPSNFSRSKSPTHSTPHDTALNDTA
jgi:hypothetical protein